MSTRTFFERLMLAALRRTAPGSSAAFQRAALYIVGQATARQTIGGLSDRDTVAVQGGPFKGLKLAAGSAATAHAAKVLGTYETQLTGWIEAAIAERPPLIVNVGSGEGYYAVGLAMRLPETDCLAFEADPHFRAETQRTAALNQVDGRIRIEGRCTPETLEAALRPGALVVMDCEGGELALLDPACVPSLRDATILVELHEATAPGVTGTLAQRFDPTHAMETIAQAVVLPVDVPAVAGLPELLLLALVNEQRERPMRWARFVPLN